MADYDQSLILGYVESDLDDDQTRHFELLMMADPRLRDLVEQMQEDRARLRALGPVTPPDGLLQPITLRLERQVLLGPDPDDRSDAASAATRMVRAVGGVAALVALIVVAAFFIRPLLQSNELLNAVRIASEQFARQDDPTPDSSPRPPARPAPDEAAPANSDVDADAGADPAPDPADVPGNAASPTLAQPADPRLPAVSVPAPPSDADLSGQGPSQDASAILPPDNPPDTPPAQPPGPLPPAEPVTQPDGNAQTERPGDHLPELVNAWLAGVLDPSPSSPGWLMIPDNAADGATPSPTTQPSRSVQDATLVRSPGSPETAEGSGGDANADPSSQAESDLPDLPDLLAMSVRPPFRVLVVRPSIHDATPDRHETHQTLPEQGDLATSDHAAEDHTPARPPLLGPSDDEPTPAAVDPREAFAATFGVDPDSPLGRQLRDIATLDANLTPAQPLPIANPTNPTTSAPDLATSPGARAPTATDPVADAASDGDLFERHVVWINVTTDDPLAVAEKLLAWSVRQSPEITVLSRDAGASRPDADAAPPQARAFRLTLTVDQAGRLAQLLETWTGQPPDLLPLAVVTPATASANRELDAARHQASPADEAPLTIVECVIAPPTRARR